MMGILGCLLAVSLTADPAAQVAGDVVHTRSKAFRIPVDLSGMDTTTLSAIRLYISRDEGRTWDRHKDEPVGKSMIGFRAYEDGTYWFSLALVDNTGAQTPADIQTTEPGLKVVLDTQPPTLVVKPVRSKSGRRGVKWECTDANLDLDSLQLAVHDAGTEAWAKFPVDPHGSPIAWFESDQQVDKMQAVVKDFAGNESIQQITLLNDEQFETETLTRFVMATEGDAPSAIPSAVPSNSKVASAGHVEPATQESRPHRFPKFEDPADSTDSTQPKVPAGRRPVPQHSEQICNSQSLALEYDLEPGTKPESVKVELWGTQDGGRTWSKLAQDPDATSPIEVDFKTPGTYGLQLMISDARDPNTAPDAGSEPSLEHVFDPTPPEVEILSVDHAPGSVTIRWRAKDTNLEKQPITIAAAGALQGPWINVATDLPNSGVYVWNYAESGMNGVVYLQVQAYDQAENVGLSYTLEGLDLGASVTRQSTTDPNVKPASATVPTGAPPAPGAVVPPAPPVPGQSQVIPATGGSQIVVRKVFEFELDPDNVTKPEGPRGAAIAAKARRFHTLNPEAELAAEANERTTTTNSLRARSKTWR